MNNSHARLSKLEADRAPGPEYFIKLPGDRYVKTSPGKPQIEITKEEYDRADGPLYTATPAQKTDY